MRSLSTLAIAIVTDRNRASVQRRPYRLRDLNRVAWILSGLAAAAIGALIVLGFARVADLDARELDRPGGTVTLTAETTQTLLEADVLEGDDLAFELCASDAMEPARWTGALTLSLDAVDAAEREHLVDQRFDAQLLSRARRGAHGACVDFLDVGPLAASGHFVLSTHDVGAGVAGVNVRARMMAERPLVARDRNGVLAILLAAVLLVAGLALRAPSPPIPSASSAWSVAGAASIGAVLALVGVALTLVQPGLSPVARVVVGLVVVSAASFAAVGFRRAWTGSAAIAAVLGIVELSTLLSFLTPPGPEFGLVAGLALGVLEIALAVALARTGGRGPRIALLGLQRPERALVAAIGFTLAPVVGVALRFAAMRALALVPSTGEAPIEAYVSWPSGLLSFAVLSVIAPVGEEIFFRGLVFGALRGAGGPKREALAFAGAWLLFVLAHLPQTWGSWGGLLAIAIAGLGFTTLRATTGSVLVSALAHLVYNGLLAAAALASV